MFLLSRKKCQFSHHIMSGNGAYMLSSTQRIASSRWCHSNRSNSGNLTSVTILRNKQSAAMLDDAALSLIIIIVRRFLTRRKMSMTLQGRASTIRLTSVTLSRQQFSQEESNRYRVFFFFVSTVGLTHILCNIHAPPDPLAGFKGAYF